MLLINDDEQPAKEVILEQQDNADKGKTTIIPPTVVTEVEDGACLGIGSGTIKINKQNCQSALRPNYLLRSAQIRKQKLGMYQKSSFCQQSDTTPFPTKRKSRLNKKDDILPPFEFEVHELVLSFIF